MTGGALNIITTYIQPGILLKPRIYGGITWLKHITFALTQIVMCDIEAAQCNFIDHLFTFQSNLYAPQKVI